MAINKNFVVKHGLEVNTDLILADASTKRVGIGSTIPTRTLDVRGGIGATDIYVTGIATFNDRLTVGSSGTIFTALASGGVGIGTTQPTSNLQVVGNVNVDGTTTIGNVSISSGIVTASTGIVSYYGDGQYLFNVTRGVGIQTAGSGGPIGFGATILDFRGPGISTVTVSAGIGTINVTGGVSIAVTSSSPSSPNLGNLWFNIDLGRTFLYYDELALGIGTDKYWIDAAPFNVGVITSLMSVSFASGTYLAPSIYFASDPSTGFFSPGPGQFTVVSAGSSILSINASGINITGVATATDFDALSDIRYKENINTVDSALSKVDQLRGVKFDWKESGLPSYGVIAQELEEVLPELVHGHDPKTVNYNGIIGVLIEAIKELKEEIEELKNAK